MRLLLRLLSPGRLLLVGTMIVAGYLLFSAGNNVLESYRIASNESELRTQVAQLQAQKDQLQQIRDYLRSDDYVEFMAHRVFGLVKPGETLVVVDAPDALTPPDDSMQGQTWWQRLFSQPPPPPPQ